MKTTSIICGILCLVFFQSSVFSNSTIGLVCPDDVWLNCGDEIWDLSIYGDAYYTDYNGNHSVGSATVHYNLNSCDAGTISRTWTYNQFSCTQTIFVFGGHFSAANIHWPEPVVELEGCNPSTDPLDLDPEDGPPTFDYVHCSHVGISHKDQTFTFGPDCKKTIRTWTLIDWCTYHPHHNAHEGIYTYYQTIKISATDTPQFTCLPDLTISSFNCKDAYVSLDSFKVASSSCGGEYSISHDSEYADTTGVNASGIYPIGTTEIKYRLSYGCGQIHYCKQKIKVIDDKRPSAYCFGNLSIALMAVDNDNDGIPEDGMVEIWAKDLDVGSYHGCQTSGLHFSFSPDLDSTSRIFTCEEVGKNDVRMYVTDYHGNQSFCIVEIDVQNNGANIPNCEPGSTKPEQTQNVFGNIQTHHGNKLEKSFVDLKSIEAEAQLIPDETLSQMVYTEEIIDSFYNSSGDKVYRKLTDSIMIMHYDTLMEYRIFNSISNEEGIYNISEVGMDYDYRIVPWRVYADDSNMNIFDVQALFNHVVGRKMIEDPYQILAADVNMDYKLDMNDVDILLEYIKGNKSHINPLERWIFVDSRYEFSNEENPLLQAYPQYIILTKHEKITDDHKFIAVCLGDIVDRGNGQTSYKNMEDYEDIELEIRNQIEPSELSVKFAPNPFTEYTRLIMDGLEEGTREVKIYNSAGQIVFETVTDQSDIYIDEIVHPGVYVYHVYINGVRSQGRLVKF